MQLFQDNGMGRDDRVSRPAFNSRASIVLEIKKDVRFDRMQQAINEVRGIHLYDITEENFTNVVFQSDRVNLKQVNEMAIKYGKRAGINIFDDTVFITSKVINTTKVGNRETRVLGSRYEPALSIEVPKSSRYGVPEVDTAFTFTGDGDDFGMERDVQIGNPESVDVDDSIVVTPNFNKKFRLSDSTIEGTYHNMAADDLKLNLSSIIYAGQVVVNEEGGLLG